MNRLGQALSGVLVALVSLIFILGSLSVALQESGAAVLLAEKGVPQAPTGGSLTGQVTGQPVSAEVPPTGTITATLSPTPLDENCQPPEGWVFYTVRVGDSVASLAVLLGVDTGTIMENNCLTVDHLIPGSDLLLPRLPDSVEANPDSITPTPTRCLPPAGWVRYQVKPKDNLYRLSLTYGVSVGELQAANCMRSTFLRAGSTIYIPNVPPRETESPKSTKTPKPSKTATEVPPTQAPTQPPPSPTPIPPSPTATPTIEIIRPTMTHTPTPIPATATETPPTPSATAIPSDTPQPPTGTPTPTATPDTKPSG